MFHLFGRDVAVKCHLDPYAAILENNFDVHMIISGTIEYGTDIRFCLVF